MLFSEVYGTYYNVLARLLEQAVSGQLTRASMYRIIREEGFEESVLTIPEALESGTWPLLREDFTTPLEHKPTMPLTTLQRQWLKALLSDPRIQLFDPPVEGLEEVKPLYPREALVYYDRYSDGDPYEDPGYIQRFRCILSAIRQKRRIAIQFTGHTGISHSWRCIPYKLEYSSKDDKFRLIASGKEDPISINLGRITDCRLLEPCREEEYCPRPMKKQTLVLELTDERNGLERVMSHFSHLDRETERIDDNRYRVTLRYEQADETELLIRVLSFGPVVRVISPEDFIQKLCQRLQKQKDMRIRA